MQSCATVDHAGAFAAAGELHCKTTPTTQLTSTFLAPSTRFFQHLPSTQSSKPKQTPSRSSIPSLVYKQQSSKWLSPLPLLPPPLSQGKSLPHPKTYQQSPTNPPQRLRPPPHPPNRPPRPTIRAQRPSHKTLPRPQRMAPRAQRGRRF